MSDDPYDPVRYLLDQTEPLHAEIAMLRSKLASAIEMAEALTEITNVADWNALVAPFRQTGETP